MTDAKFLPHPHPAQCQGLDLPALLMMDVSRGFARAQQFGLKGGILAAEHEVRIQCSL